MKTYIALLRGINVLDAIDFNGDEFTIDEKSIYLIYTNPAGRSKLNNAIIENKLKVRATIRNWKTIYKLIEMAEPANDN